MKTLVVFDTKHGGTRRIAEALAKAIGGETDLVELGSGAKADLRGYDAAVLGAPVYAGTWSKKAAAFARDNAAALGAMRFAAFSSGFAIEKGGEPVRAALPQKLAESALAIVGLGGALTLAELSPFERFITKAVAKVSSDVSTVRDAAIAELAAAVKGGAK